MTELWALAARVGAKLIARGETVAVAESSSGGLLSAALLSVPGASAYFQAGAVVYTAKARTGLLDISRDDVRGMRSASEPYALLLARTARTRFGTDWALSETGAAGPSGNPYGDAPGHSCLALAGPAEKVCTLETAKDDRLDNMFAFAAKALELLDEALDEPS